MQVMTDSNIILSALLFPNGIAAKAFEKCLQEEDLCLCTKIIEECHDVVAKKFPKRIKDLDIFFENLVYTLLYTPSNPEPDLFEIRDKKDYPILYTAIKEDIDLFITGDKDYQDVQIEKPKILTPKQYLEI